ncbi:hypothetical protein QN375_24050 [Pseudomonas sp. MH9.2]|uniref:O-antigen ligase family protein n=1 Tax=unclassified Pseudomonas TaxID=196821 RepID=UPI002AC8F5EF|nr:MULTISPECIES: hypothetical protein [unclassified Pseudomonas]MEB0028812.1 hypothetical protein [Pseudomonas sp. MH9.2]MEB0150092.1 hypothetical protein [Pseudomonas sp. CCC2.2]MEE3509534.1 hypothetical protein [Pseudomonas sp. 10C3]WPX68865.1 hypothetical protein RHM55_24760 [Pseudomonas sp. MH9.2]
MKRIRAKAPLICLVYILLIFIPAELNWLIGPVRIEAYRLFLIAAALLLASKMMNHKYDRKELALVIFCGLSAISYIYVHNAAGVQSALILILEVFVSYWIGLQVGGNIHKLRGCITLIMTMFLLLVPFAIVESLSGYRSLHVLFATIADTKVDAYLGESYFRHGLHRAGTVFAHPILYSVISVMYIGLLFRLYNLPLIVLFCFAILTAIITSVTSAGLLMLLMLLVLFLMQKSTRYFPSVFKLAVILSGFIFIFLSFASNQGPIQLLIQLTSLNTDTAFARYMQWQFASMEVLRNPIFGIGFNEWARPYWMAASIDSYWLTVMLKSGIPALIALSVFFILSLKAYWQAFQVTREWLYFCFFIAICSFILGAFTVDYFDRAQLMLYLTMGFFNSFVSKKSTETGKLNI